MDRKAQIQLLCICILCSLIPDSVSELKNIEIIKAQPMHQGDPDYINWGTIRLTKSGKGRDLTISGTLQVLRDLEEPEIEVSYALYRKTAMSKSYPKTPIVHYTSPICQALSQETMFYPDLVAASNFPKPGTCPFPKGSYTVQNFILHEEKVRNLLPGDYKLIINFTKEKKIIAGYEFLAVVT